MCMDPWTWVHVHGSMDMGQATRLHPVSIRCLSFCVLDLHACMSGYRTHFRLGTWGPRRTTSGLRVCCFGWRGELPGVVLRVGSSKRTPDGRSAGQVRHGGVICGDTLLGRCHQATTPPQLPWD